MKPPPLTLFSVAGQPFYFYFYFLLELQFNACLLIPCWYRIISVLWALSLGGSGMSALSFLSHINSAWLPAQLHTLFLGHWFFLSLSLGRHSPVDSKGSTQLPSGQISGTSQQISCEIKWNTCELWFNNVKVTDVMFSSVQT